MHARQDLRPNGEFVFKLPPLNEESRNQNTTGYSILKYVEYNTTYIPTIDGEGKSQAPAIQFRYADILLNYAEALAELDGAANASKIKEALRPLRERVGMPEMDFDREFNTDPDYPFNKLDKYIQAVRRERRIEKALEEAGFKISCAGPPQTSSLLEKLQQVHYSKGALWKPLMEKACKKVKIFS